MTHPNSTAVVRPEETHRNIRCARLGFRSFVNKATTASFGIANDKMPGQKAAIVDLMVFCRSSMVRLSKCCPLPDAAAALEIPRLTNAQTLLQSALGREKTTFWKTYHGQQNQVVVEAKSAHHLDADK